MLAAALLLDRRIHRPKVRSDPAWQNWAASLKHRVKRHTWVGGGCRVDFSFVCNSEQQRKGVIYSTVCPRARALRNVDKENSFLKGRRVLGMFYFCVGLASLLCRTVVRPNAYDTCGKQLPSATLLLTVVFTTELTETG